MLLLNLSSRKSKFIKFGISHNVATNIRIMGKHRKISPLHFRLLNQTSLQCSFISQDFCQIISDNIRMSEEETEEKEIAYLTEETNSNVPSETTDDTLSTE